LKPFWEEKIVEKKAVLYEENIKCGGFSKEEGILFC
jgi:hypothetical protein